MSPITLQLFFMPSDYCVMLLGFFEGTLVFDGVAFSSLRYMENGQPINEASVGRLLSKNWHTSYFNVSDYSAIIFYAF